MNRSRIIQFLGLWGQAWLDKRSNYSPEEVLQADFLFLFLFYKDYKPVSG